MPSQLVKMNEMKEAQCLAQNRAHVAHLHKCNATSLSLFPSVLCSVTRSHVFMKSLGDFEEQGL